MRIKLDGGFALHAGWALELYGDLKGNKHFLAFPPMSSSYWISWFY